MVTLCSDLCLEFAGQSCGTTVTVWSVSMDKRPCFHAGRRRVRARDDSSSELFVFFFRTVASPKKKKKKFGRERGTRERVNEFKELRVPSVFITLCSTWNGERERERERKRKGGAREDLWTGSTPMHLPTPFASSCSLVAGNYRRGNFWYDSNDGKESLLDLDAFFLPFLFFFSPVTEFTHRVVRSR